MLIPSNALASSREATSLSRRVNANSQRHMPTFAKPDKLIKKGEC